MRNCFCILFSLSNVLVQLIWYRRNHLLNKYRVNGEQGCRELIFSCDKDDLKSAVSIGVLCLSVGLQYSSGSIFPLSRRMLTSKKGIEVVDCSLVNLMVGWMLFK